MSDDTPDLDHIADKLGDGRTLYAHESRALLERVRDLESKLHAAESIMDDNETLTISVDCPICGRREIEECAVATRKQVSCRACGTEWVSRKSLYKAVVNER
jgi:transposase-like protein